MKSPFIYFFLLLGWLFSTIKKNIWKVVQKINLLYMYRVSQNPYCTQLAALPDMALNMGHRPLQSF